MSARSDYEAAYFTLLRAVEERDDLLRYREFLDAERQRLDAFAEQTQAVTDALPRKLRRPVGPTTKPLLEALGRRRVVVDDERGRVDERITNAEAFVAECEQDVAALRP